VIDCEKSSEHVSKMLARAKNQKWQGLKPAISLALCGTAEAVP
jgi:hypothetical protein